MSDLISREAALNEAYDVVIDGEVFRVVQVETLIGLPTIDAIPVVRCKDCIHQEKFFHEDKRRKDGGYYIYGCELADGYSHVCLDDDFCSKGERRTYV